MPMPLTVPQQVQYFDGLRASGSSAPPSPQRVRDRSPEASAESSRRQRRPRVGAVTEKFTVDEPLEQDVVETLEEKGAEEGSIGVEEAAWVDMPQGLETPAVRAGIDVEIDLAESWDLFDVVNREVAYGYGFEDTRWVIRIDAKYGSM